VGDVPGGGVDRRREVAPLRAGRRAHGLTHFVALVEGTREALADAVDLQRVDALPDAFVLELAATGDVVRAHDVAVRTEEQSGVVHELVDPGLLLAGQRGAGFGDRCGGVLVY